MTDQLLDQNVSAVIVGFDGGINYWKLMFAASYAQNREIPFIGTNSDECFIRSGLVLPGICVSLAYEFESFVATSFYILFLPI